MNPSIIETIFQIGIVILIVFSAFHWARTGFWVPIYIHFMALFMLFVAVSASYLSYKANDPDVNKSIYYIIGFPLIIYVLYGLYGGGIHSRDIKINDDLIIDRAMKKDEVIEIFREHFAPYTKWEFENLILLTARDHQSEIQGKSGKPYLFELLAGSYEGKGEEKIVTIYGRLTEFKRKFYKPQSHVVFEIGRKGTVYRDGLNLNT